MGDPKLGQRLVAAARLARWEASIERAVAEALDARRKRALTIVATSLTASLPPDPFELDTWDTDVEVLVAPTIEVVLAEVAKVTAQAILGPAADVRIDLTYRLDRMIGLMRGLGPETSEAIGRALTEGVNRGEGIPKLSARVVDVFGSSAKRATLISRTEVVGSANGAAFDVASDLHYGGLLLEKSWLAAHDSRVRPEHAEADGQTVAMDQPFVVGGAELMYPGDPDGPAEAVCNCRCTSTFDETATGD